MPGGFFTSTEHGCPRTRNDKLVCGDRYPQRKPVSVSVSKRESRLSYPVENRQSARLYTRDEKSLTGKTGVTIPVQ